MSASATPPKDPALIPAWVAERNRSLPGDSQIGEAETQALVNKAQQYQGQVSAATAVDPRWTAMLGQSGVYEEESNAAKLAQGATVLPSDPEYGEQAGKVQAPMLVLWKKDPTGPGETMYRMQGGVMDDGEHFAGGRQEALKKAAADPTGMESVALGLWMAGVGMAAGQLLAGAGSAAGTGGAVSSSASMPVVSFGDLGSGLTGVSLPAAGLESTAVGSLGSGLAGTTAAEIGTAAVTPGIMSTIGTNAAIGAGKAAVTGGDPLKGAVTGAIGGAIGASGIGGSVADALNLTGDAAAAVSSGVTQAAKAGASTLVNGGSFSDVLEDGVIGGITAGVNSYVTNTVGGDGVPHAVSSGAGGAAAGATNAILTGGDIAAGIMTGGAAGAAGGAVQDLGGGSVLANAAGSVAGGIVNSAVQPDPVVVPQPTQPNSQSTPTGSYGLSFGDMVPTFVNRPRADMQWGTRLNNKGV